MVRSELLTPGTQLRHPDDSVESCQPSKLVAAALSSQILLHVLGVQKRSRLLWGMPLLVTTLCETRRNIPARIPDPIPGSHHETMQLSPGWPQADDITVVWLPRCPNNQTTKQPTPPPAATKMSLQSQVGKKSNQFQSPTWSR